MSVQRWSPAAGAATGLRAWRATAREGEENMIRTYGWMTTLAVIGLLSPAVAGEVEVHQQGKAFVPESATIAAGDSLVFLNDDNVGHNVTATGPDMDVNSGLQKPGESYTLNFESPGDYDVRCVIHPKMKMSVKVQ
jgi:plastocyanin